MKIVFQANSFTIRVHFIVSVDLYHSSQHYFVSFGCRTLLYTVYLSDTIDDHNNNKKLLIVH